MFTSVDGVDLDDVVFVVVVDLTSSNCYVVNGAVFGMTLYTYPSDVRGVKMT